MLSLLRNASVGLQAWVAAREIMVRDHMQKRGIRHKAVLQAMRSTPRHEFVPDALREQAYEDHPLPIGHAATISQPYIVAFMTELLEPQPWTSVLEIGTGSGYQAAILSRLVREVYSIEIVQDLACESAARLHRLGYRNVVVRQGDGYRGWPEKAPFDRIILTAAPPELPEVLVSQLKPGGILVAPVGTGDQRLLLVRKGMDGRVVREPVIPVMFIPMVPGPLPAPPRN